MITVCNRSWMGYKPSPYCAVRSYYLAEEFIVGDISSLTNPFRYDEVILTLPGNEDFNPALRRVYKWDRIKNMSAVDMKMYVDN